MAYDAPEREDFSLTLPLTQAARHLAQQLAQQQPTPQKAAQVRLNTLAILVAQNYLEMMGIPTDLAAGESWHPVTRLCADVADLVIPQMGRLECRPVEVGESVCLVPAETWHDRLGYLVVELNEPASEATLKGFISQVDDEVLQLSQLQPIEALLEHLQLLSNAAIAPTATPSPSTALAYTLVNLSQWLQQQFAAGWEAVETVLNPSQLSPAYGFRTTAVLAMPSGQAVVSRAKLIDLGARPLNYPAALVIELNPESVAMMNIRLTIHPIDDAFLPPDLRLTVLDEAGDVFLETQSMGGDFYLQLQFSWAVGDRFTIQLALNDITVSETFMV